MPTKKAVKKDKVQVENAAVVEHAVPMPMDAVASSTISIDDIDLSGNVGDEYASHGTATAKDVKDRPVITITDPELEDQFLEFAATKELFDIFEARKKTESKQVYEKLWEIFKDKIWQHRVQPKNPVIEVVINGVQEAKGTFMVKGGSSFKVNMSRVAEKQHPRDVFVNDLMAAGFSNKVMAVEIFEKELDTTPSWTLNFTECMHGRIMDKKFISAEPAEMDAAKKLFIALQGEQKGKRFDLATRRALLNSIDESGLDSLRKNILANVVYNTCLKSPDGFLDRVCEYCSSREDLDAILTVITPQYYCSYVKFAPTADAAVKSQRLATESDQIVRSELGLGKAS